MSDPARAAFRQGLATSLTALVVGAFHVPQPFLAVLAAQLVGGFACNTGAEFLKRLGAAWAGSLAGLSLLVAAPDQQWISLPLFGLAAGFGIPFAFRRLGPAPATLFAMGIGGMFSAGLVHPGSGLLSGMAHAASLSIAAAASVLAWSACMRAPIITISNRGSGVPPLGYSGKRQDAASTKPPDQPCALGDRHDWGMRGTQPALPAADSLDPAGESPNPAIIGLCAPASLVVAALTVPTEAVVLTIATMTTILALQTTAGSPAIGQRLAGAATGILVSVAFLAIISGSGNNLAVFLAAMAIVMGGFEWLASSLPAKGNLFRQAAAIFAVAATMLPRPDRFLFASVDRMLAVVLGFAVAVAFFLILWQTRFPRLRNVPRGTMGDISRG